MLNRLRDNVARHCRVSRIRARATRCLAVFLGSSLGLLTGSASLVAAELPVINDFHKSVQPILKEYCYDCHGDGAKKGGIAYDELKSNEEILNHDLWQKVLNNTRAGLMPPLKKPRPSPEQQQSLEKWIKYEAFGIDPNDPDPGRVTVRRLNRVEYKNTIRDLMGVEYDTEGEFPPDDTGYGLYHRRCADLVADAAGEIPGRGAHDHQQSGANLGRCARRKSHSGPLVQRWRNSDRGFGTRRVIVVVLRKGGGFENVQGGARRPL